MRVKFLLVITFSLASFVAVQAQEQEPQQSSSTGAVQSSPLDVQGLKSYLLGPGDVVEIRVFGQPDLSSTAQVDSDGNLSSLPFLEEPIPAKCRTEKAVQKDIAAAYSKLINNPQVSVRITERNSRQPATVFGAVRQSVRLEMKRKVRLNEVIAASGGFTERASGTIQVLHTEPVMCPEPGEEVDSQPIDGTKIPLQIVKIADLRAGKVEANPVIRPGDYVLVTEAEPVYLTGAVISPQGVFLREQLTLSRALAMVGGVRKEAKLTDVRVYRQKPGSTEQDLIHVDMAAIKKSQKPDFLLMPYDVVEVPEAGAFSSQRIGTTLVGAITGGLSGAITSSGTYLPTRILY
jgi:polysaccharide export outer membrane protein